METEYASKGVAGAGLGLGIAGTALGLLNGGLGGLGLGANGATMAAGAVGLGAMAAKDAEIAQLKAERASITNTADLFRATSTRDREIEGRLSAVESTQKAEAAAFIEYRTSQKEIAELREKLLEQKITTVASTAATAAAGLQGEIARLAGVVASVTKIVVPNTSVCPGWGPVTITPETPAP